MLAKLDKVKERRMQCVIECVVVEVRIHNNLRKGIAYNLCREAKPSKRAGII